MTRKKKTGVDRGEPTVLIEGRPVAVLHATHDGTASGEPTVLVGGRPVVVLKNQGDRAAPTVLANNRCVRTVTPPEPEA